nr:hypothetical protein CFP56_69325 [Quercus suber]
MRPRQAKFSRRDRRHAQRRAGRVDADDADEMVVLSTISSRRSSRVFPFGLFWYKSHFPSLTLPWRKSAKKSELRCVFPDVVTCVESIEHDHFDGASSATFARGNNGSRSREVLVAILQL